MPRIRLDGVTRRFGSPRAPVEALRGISLVVEQGDFLAIEGPSGGGKSTLLNILGLLDIPTDGDVEVGSDAASADEAERSRLRSDRFAFIFQSFHLLDHRPVIESVELALLYRGVSWQDRRMLAMEALETLGIGSLAWQKAGTLSGGERQRVAIARALATGAPIVVADEPTGNLDSENSAAVVRCLTMLHDRGCTVILVTHSPEVAAVATRRLHLRDGRLVEVTDDQPRASALGGEPVPATNDALPPGRASRLHFRDLLTDALSSVTSRLGRSAGLIAAVAVAVGLAVATLGISVTADSQVSSTFNAHTNRDVTANWKTAELAVQPRQAQSSLAKRLVGLHGVDAVALVQNHDNHVVQASRARPAYEVTTYTVAGHYAAASRSSIRWAQGRAHRVLSGEMLVGKTLAKQLHIGPLIDGPVVTVDGRSVTVVGIISSSPRLPDIMGAVVLPQGDAHLLGSTPGSTTALILTKAGAANEVAHQVPLVIDPYKPHSVSVDAPTDPTTLRAEIQADVSTTLVVLTGIALLASVAALANAMVLSVIERKSELGLRRAVGARPAHIVGLILAESAIIGAVGGVIGLGGGLAAILGITISRHWAPVFDLRLAPAAIVGGILVGAVGGIVAAVRASRVQPGQALRL